MKKLYDMGIIDASFIAIDSTPVAANTTQNNPKSFSKNKFDPQNHPKNDLDCKLGVHTASNQHNEKNYEFFLGLQKPRCCRLYQRIASVRIYNDCRSC